MEAAGRYPHPAVALMGGWALGLGCSHVDDPSEPGVPDGPPIERVEIDGVTRVARGELLAGLANRPPEFVWLSPGEGLFLTRRRFRYDELQVELDRQRIRSFYQRRGLFGATVSGPESRLLEGEAGLLEMRWVIDEGQTTQVVDVVFAGAPDELVPALRRVVDLEVGATYESAAFEAAQVRLRKHLLNSGYAEARVSGRVQIDEVRGEARVVFDVDSGPQVRLYALIAEGPVRTPTSAVVVRKTWNDGDRFDPALLERLRGRLYGIDQYLGVRIDHESIDADLASARIVARVEEKEQNELQTGLGVGFDPATAYARLRARYKRRNFPFDLTNVAVEVIPAFQLLRQGGQCTFCEGELTVEGRATLTWYDFLWPRFELVTDAGFQYEQLEAYEWFGPDVGQNLRRAIFDDRLQAALGWRFHQYAYADARVFGPGSTSPLAPPAGETPQEILNITDSQSVIILQPSLTFEGRDSAVQSTRGWFGRLGLDLGLAAGPGSTGFLLLNGELRGYLPLGDRLVIAARAELATTAFGDLPAPRRLYAGGAASQRGFAQRRLSRSAILIDGDGNAVASRGDDPATTRDEAVMIPIGGRSVVEVGLEARIKLAQLFGFWFGTAVFIDGADLGEQLSDLRFPGLHYAAGLGLRYYTPIGAIRVDYGYRLNRTDEAVAPCRDLDCGALHFSIGQAF